MKVAIPRAPSAAFLQLLVLGFEQIKNENAEGERDPRYLAGVLEDSLGLEQYELISTFGDFLQAEGLRAARLPSSREEISNAWEQFAVAQRSIVLAKGLNPAMMLC